VSVRRDPAGTIRLEGGCPVEDAEPLLRLLQDTPAARLDWSQCGVLHSAVVQIVLAARPELDGTCGDPLVARWIAADLPQDFAR
jgi:hypothetical protein